MNRGSVKGGGLTRIGDFNLFMANVHIGHDCQLGDHIVIANASTLAGHGEIGNYVNISGLCATHQFVRIGDYAMLGAGAMVSQDIAPFMLASGDRARLYGLNVIGLKRNGFSAATIRQLKRAYQLLFRTSHRFQEAVTAISEEGLDSPQIDYLINFLHQSQRGFARCGN